MGLVNNCDFKGTSGASTLYTTTGVIPDVSQPIQPLSDVTSIRKK
jgi:hypothetical protein